MYASALRAGLKPLEFWSMTFNEFAHYIEGQNNRELAELSNTRLIAWSNLAPNSKRKIKPQDVISIPELDSKPKPKPKILTKEQHEQNLRKLRKAFNK